MNAQQKELFRKAVLRVLDTNRSRYGLGVVALAHQLGIFGFRAEDFATEDEPSAAKAMRDAILDELQYLETKRLIEEVQKTVSAENRAWRISDQGIAFLDANG